MDNKQTGRIGLSMAINYFTINGYTVSLPINDTQWYDLIVEKDGVFETVQCKCTNTKSNTIDLRCTGGTSGKVYDNVLNHTNLTYLFCVDNNLKMFLIPMKDLLCYDSKRSISLRYEPNPNGQGFNTYTYLIQDGKVE